MYKGKRQHVVKLGDMWMEVYDCLQLLAHFISLFCIDILREVYSQ